MLKSEQLKELFVEVFSLANRNAVGDGNPFLVKIKSKRYYVYLKNISPAYFKNSPDIVRVQLPFSTKFENISKSVIPLIVLGYNDDEDTYTAWNPILIKSRLNHKSNVSLYSRKAFSSQLTRKRITSGYLNTGEQVLILKRKYILDFFEQYEKLFGGKIAALTNDATLKQEEGYINEIKDKELLKLIVPLIRKRQILESVEVCSKYYGRKYSKMTFSDWFKLIQKLIPD